MKLSRMGKEDCDQKQKAVDSSHSDSRGDHPVRERLQSSRHRKALIQY
jgi:hypothetical protein